MSASVSAWLQELGLEQYAELFEANDIDWELLADIDQQTLREIGVQSVGHRIRILKAIGKLQAPAALAPAAAAAPGEAAADPDITAWQRRPGERKPVTMLFADLVGSTALTEELDAEEAHDLVYLATQRMCRAVESNNGTVCRFMGDGIMAMFGAPLASERHALEACRAALAMQAGIAEYAAQLDGDHADRVKIRVGLHSGEVVVLEVGDDPQNPEYDASGPTVPLAARMEQSANPGNILISAETRMLASAAIATRDHPPVAVKGFSEAVEVFELERILSAAESARVAIEKPIIGRRSELAQFRGLLESCVEDNSGQCLHLRGEAGIGKTRLVGEMTRLAQSRDYLTHKALVLDFGTGRGQGAIPSLLKSLLGTDENAAGPECAAALARAISDGLLDEQNRVFMNDLLDLEQPLELKTLYDAMDVETRNEGKRVALAELINRLAARSPLAIVFEDLHWADAATLDYLASIAAAVVDSAVLLVFTSRVEGDPVDEKWRGAAGGIPIVTWDLRPLRRAECLQIVSAFTNTDVAHIERCIERADGNPLFLEQLLLSSPAGGGRIPDSIKSLVLARIDQLPVADKRALQAAAILGQRFDLDSLLFLVDDPGYDCGSLIERQLIKPEGPYYLFVHALIQEGAYASLLKAQRAALHAKAAARYRERDAELHAVHLDQAGDSGAAAAYLAAGREYLAAYRPERALEFARRGIEIAPAATRFALKCLEGELLRAIGATGESIEVFRAAMELAGDDAERCRALVGLAEGLAIIEAHDELERVLAAAETLARHLDYWLELAVIHQLRGGMFFFQGEHEQCLSACNFSLECARKTDTPEVVARALSGLADSTYCRGRFHSANRYYTECIDFSRQHGLGRVLAANLSMRGFTFRYRNQPEAALRDYREALELAARTRHLRAESVACYAGLYLAEMGEHEEGEALLRRGLAISTSLGSSLLQSAALIALSRLIMNIGERAEALSLARQAIEILGASESGMAFRGPSALGALALATEDDDERRAALAEGKALLSSSSMGHNHFNFCEDGIDTCLQIGDWDGVDWFTSHLRDYTRDEPLPFSEFIVARATALAEFGRGERSESLLARLEELSEQAGSIKLFFQRQAVDQALEQLRAATAAKPS